MLIWLLTGCDHRDEQLQSKLTGSWFAAFGTLTMGANGTFISKWTNAVSTNEFIYEGTWRVEDGVLIVSCTKSNGAPFSDTNYFNIIRVNERELVYQYQTLETISLTRIK